MPPGFGNDAEEFDFEIASESDEPQTEGEDLQLLFQEELEGSSEEDSSRDCNTLI